MSNLQIKLVAGKLRVWGPGGVDSKRRKLVVFLGVDVVMYLSTVKP